MPPLPANDRGMWVRGSAEPAVLDDVFLQDNYDVPEPWLTVPNVLRLLWRRRGLVLSGTFALSLLGIVITLLLPRSYEGETMIVVDPRREQISSVIQQVVSALPAEDAALRSEVDALQSSGLIRSVVEHAKLVSIPEFNPTLRDAGVWGLAFWLDKDGQKALKQKAAAFTQSIKGLFGASAPEEVKSDDPVAVAAAIYQNKKLKVSTDGRSLTIRLNVKSDDAELAAGLANLHAELYLAQQFNSKVLATERVRNWLTERIEPLKADLQRADAAVQRYREESQLIATSSQGVTVTVQQLAELNTQLTLVRSEKAQDLARLEQVRNLIRKGSPLESVPDVLASPLVQKLREQESYVNRIEADAAARFANANHPSIISAKAQLAELQKALKNEVSKIATSLQRAVEISSAKERSLERALEQLTKRAAAANLSEVKLRELERDAESTRALYETLLNRRQETAFGPISRLPDSRVISAANVPLSPAFPKYTLFFAASIVVAAAASTGFAFLVEGAQRPLHSPTQCNDMLGVRGLGLVPRIGGWRPRRIADCVVDEGVPRDAVRSVLEILRATRGADRPRSISITSAVPHEGKTILSIWLARVSAMMGLRVLLVDADLRRPAVAKYLGLRATARSTSKILISGEGLMDVVREDPLTGMHYVTCQNQDDKIQGVETLQDLETFLQEARDLYDLVIVDSAPILAAPESLSVCRMTDGVIFAVHWGHTSPRQARHAVSMLRPAKANLLGAVVTRADVRKHTRYAYGDVGDVYFRHKAYYRA